MKPDDHNSTNTAGAAKTAAFSQLRGIFVGPAVDWHVPNYLAGAGGRVEGRASGGD
jgi:hypothetical protein